MDSEIMVEDQTKGCIQLKEQFTCVEDYAPKARKPYTITKQRERWSQEDHNKFLEALKLHGRAWRLIQEHVGTKTTVQIRSHAQKFFSKVVRDSGCVDGAQQNLIEIPPPRAKRRPMHPYPRKISTPLENETRFTRSVSTNSSGSDHKKLSPVSVLSADGSSSDLCLPNENLGSLICGEKISPEVVSTQSLKLFGKTFFVTNYCETSSSEVEDKGFVRYISTNTHSFMLTSEEREEQRVRLCL